MRKFQEEIEMKVVIGSDKSGFTLKEAVKAHLTEKGFEVEDCGTQDLDHVKPFFVTAAALAPKIQNGEFEKGILVCGTGAGMAIVANKYKGVYAMPCTDIYDARMCRAINDANVMTMGGWKLAPEVGCEMADVFLISCMLNQMQRTGSFDNVYNRKHVLLGCFS